MARVETLTAYKCTFEYLRRNNPLRKEVEKKMKEEIPPEYTFSDFIKDFSQYTSSLAIGKSTERAISLPKEKIYSREKRDGTQRWRIVPYAGKQGKPFHIIKTSTGQKYDFGADSAALYEHNIFMYEMGMSMVAIFHRQNGSGCKSVFLEVANKMLHEKGMKMEMELYMPLVSEGENIHLTKLQLQYVRDAVSSDAAENMRKRKRTVVIQELTLNLESDENSIVKNILTDMKMGCIPKDVALAKIKSQFTDTEIYNDAEICLRIGKKQQRVRWNEFETLIGNYDITERLHSKYKEKKDYISALSELADEYYFTIIEEEIIDG